MIATREPAICGERPTPLDETTFLLSRKEDLRQVHSAIDGTIHRSAGEMTRPSRNQSLAETICKDARRPSQCVARIDGACSQCRVSFLSPARGTRELAITGEYPTTSFPHRTHPRPAAAGFEFIQAYLMPEAHEPTLRQPS